MCQNKDPVTYTIPELAAKMQIGKAAAYQLVKQPGFPVVKVGKRIVVPIVSFQRWLERQAAVERDK